MPSHRLPLRRSSHFSALRKAGSIAIVAFAFAAGLLADTPLQLRRVGVDECYCHCAEGHTRAGCAKMCELPKYAKRWWATTCAKPRYQPPADESHAGPHLHHPDRAQHAKL
ncbi:MAG TPA: hypothetical protein VJP87_08260 [Candidatus Acidoferrales bacterium]|nr:hypothetical protein [Candidatus Acidoferrales bacterium]